MTQFTRELGNGPDSSSKKWLCGTSNLTLVNSESVLSTRLALARFVSVDSKRKISGQIDLCHQN